MNDEIPLSQVHEVIPNILAFVSVAQLHAMAEGCAGEERAFFKQKIIDLWALIEAMPVTYEQDGKGDEAVAYLHYFTGSSDWYITEKDMCGGVAQAYGYAILNGDDQMAEIGYISIKELIRCGVELDLHFSPCTLGEIKQVRENQNEPVMDTSKQKSWVIVSNPGTDDEQVFDEFDTYEEAAKKRKEACVTVDIMKRTSDGGLTTEF